MEKITEEIISLIHHYPTTPMYSLQMNKQGCKLVVEMENNVDYRLVENNGESIMIPLNVMITRSGKQRLKVKIYPKDGDQYLTKYAHVQINIFNAPSKNSSLKEYVKIAEFILPQGLEAKKLPYYEQNVDFKARVPFDYSEELNTAMDLSKIKGIEEKVVKKYNEVREICENSDIIAYNKLSIHSSVLVYNTTYTSAEDIKNGQKSNRFGVVESNLKNRKFLPIENYIVQFYANNKIVALWQKNHNPSLFMNGENSTGKIMEGGDPLFLYMPEGSTELKAW
ncbi:hypothetical protein [Chryseobacterium caseinilyticum]|uniref:Uncharacterized protein n=1 Tax=Chryseobacterium caseinilyticum TaxID=2771428 RepID=A0ABR8ZCX8_9FLAO|nr:hypothetical protein [Chryseobacterium caseinilyticum]MBD8083100.1 hypothetical protein [Chryseobacterium caseinilyticum]